ncbi:MAG: rod shape-determining protein MreD [Candidatus Magnetoovum sp. WYHC-5]|nr:rod shape-determining protein MreD [Candidatus Magnetoovum sp. WYHC-5]
MTIFIKIRHVLILILVCMGFILIDEVEFFNFKLNVVMLFLYYMGLNYTQWQALIWAAGVGVVLDSISLRLIGPNMIANGMVIVSAYIVRNGIFNLTPMLHSLFCFFTTVLFGLIVYTSLTIFDRQPADFNDAFKEVIFQSLVNGFAAYIAFRFLIKKEEDE